jgi:hypothetical protein
MRSPLAAGVLAGSLLCAAQVGAVTNEPDGSQIPRDSKNGEVQLYTLFQQRGDPVDWLAESHTTPATFSPLCNFQATFVLHQAGANRGVGWYNAVPGATAPPALGQIHVVVPAGTPVGTVISSATIKGDPAYAGGLIGFALVDGQIHYSEQVWNVVCGLCGAPAPWILSVTYQSKKTPNAYYLAFEDGSVSAFNFGNDGDFNDDVFYFEGLTCEGGGTPCDTGKPGMCAAGLNECTGTGLVCKSVIQPVPEKCDGVDNDCNGQTDEGDLCQPGFVCDHGTCVARCGGGEFACSHGQVCNTNGYCVDPACATVSCPAGSVCVGGACKQPCDGVKCPAPTVCRVGVCADPCAGVECKPGTACSGGVCVPGCGCHPCPTGMACDASTELCVEPRCLGIVCGRARSCIAGTCIDACAGAVCPSGQSCTLGACVSPPGGGTTGAGGARGFEGGLFTGVSAGGAGAAPPSGPGTGPDAGAGATSSGAAGPPPVSAPLGCGCRAVGGRSTGLPWLGSGAAFLFLLRARRRRHSARNRRGHTEEYQDP